MVRRRIRSDAPLFTDLDYNFIMQRRDERPRHKVLKDLTEKYGTSSKRIYQIWRGEEINRVAWDQPLDTVLPEAPKQTPVVDLYIEEKVQGGSDAIVQLPMEALSKTQRAPLSVSAGAPIRAERPLEAKARNSSLSTLLLKKNGRKEKADLGDSVTVNTRPLKKSPTDNFTRVGSKLEAVLEKIEKRNASVS